VPGTFIIGKAIESRPSVVQVQEYQPMFGRSQCSITNQVSISLTVLYLNPDWIFFVGLFLTVLVSLPNLILEHLRSNRPLDDCFLGVKIKFVISSPQPL